MDAQPVLFLAHGSPLLALEGGAWGEAMAALGRSLPGVRAFLVCSAHWETPGPFRLSSADVPGILHDFGGFPEALYRLDYPAPGAPELASQAAARLRQAGLEAVLDPARPLDHGAWVPLRYLAPQASVPVLQISLPRPRTPALLRAAGRALAPLRQQGVVIVASGGLVHNLHRQAWAGEAAPEPWASAFQAWMDDALEVGGPEAVEGWPDAPGAMEAVPSTEHLDPLFLALGATGGRPVRLHDGWQHRNLSLASYRWDGLGPLEPGLPEQP